MIPRNDRTFSLRQKTYPSRDLARECRSRPLLPRYEWQGPFLALQHRASNMRLAIYQGSWNRIVISGPSFGGKKDVPASSGLGNLTVGNSGSGLCCSFTGMKGLKPKHSKPWLRNTSLTPCIEVLTNLTFVDSLRTLERMSFQRSVN